VEEETYTVQEAARILRTTERTVRRRLERGDLQGTRDLISGRWRVAAHSVTAAMPERPPKAPQEALETSESIQDYQERLREVEEVRASLERQLGRLEGRLELSEQAHSTLQESLERERSRADRLEEELREARRPWWSRIFGQ
jgi:excisionase family DNA binding protein